MKSPRPILVLLSAILLLSGSLILVKARQAASEKAESQFSSITKAEIIEQRDEARRTRDQLQRDLDVMTRERVDVDGELTRLKKELKELKSK